MNMTATNACQLTWMPSETVSAETGGKVRVEPPGFETREIGPHEENGERLHHPRVKYPPSIPTHCAEQVLYFNGQGLLQRVDYSADVVGDLVAGAVLFTNFAF